MLPAVSDARADRMFDKSRSMGDLLHAHNDSLSTQNSQLLENVLSLTQAPPMSVFQPRKTEVTVPSIAIVASENIVETPRQNIIPTPGVVYVVMVVAVVTTVVVIAH